jgi:rhodanese-related sulfurtransferase
LPQEQPSHHHDPPVFKLQACCEQQQSSTPPSSDRQHVLHSNASTRLKANPTTKSGTSTPSNNSPNPPTHLASSSVFFPTPSLLYPPLTIPLTDVREPAEYAAGYIPTAINIPVGSAPDALFMPAHEFEDKFGFEKPTADQELVFYCKAGVRSSAAAGLAKQVGYKSVGEYRGSWLEWSKNGGRAEYD